MTPEDLDLARALVALPSWPSHWPRCYSPLWPTRDLHSGTAWTVVDGVGVLDLHDAGTAGVLLGVLRERCLLAPGGAHEVHAAYIAETWSVVVVTVDFGPDRTTDRETVSAEAPHLGVAVARALLAMEGRYGE